MPVAVTVQNLLDYLGGTGAASPRDFYGVSVPDATITARAIDPAKQHYDTLFDAAFITKNQAKADRLAVMRASQHLLAHLRQAVLAGGRPDAYTIGSMSVTRPSLLVLIKDSIAQAELEEHRLYALLASAGVAKGPADLKVENPIEDPEGVSNVNLDQPPYGGFV